MGVVPLQTESPESQAVEAHTTNITNGDAEIPSSTQDSSDMPHPSHKEKSDLPLKVPVENSDKPTTVPEENSDKPPTVPEENSDKPPTVPVENSGNQSVVPNKDSSDISSSLVEEQTEVSPQPNDNEGHLPVVTSAIPVIQVHIREPSDETFITNNHNETEVGNKHEADPAGSTEREPTAMSPLLDDIKVEGAGSLIQPPPTPDTSITDNA